MCIGMANGGKEPEYLKSKSAINGDGKIIIPENMLKKLNIKEWEVLQLTATGNVIVIEKCEVEEE
jgi:bifunctional DNA-binding transcriptional regulator/antitoxin component of YhaV-PrlF toxin-antitoxin module